MAGRARLSLCVAAYLLVTSCSALARLDEPLKRFEFRQPHMGTEFRILLYTTDETAARRASDAAFARVEQLNSILSDYDPESEVMRLCALAGGPGAKVSSELFEVTERSLAIAGRSGGAFDPTVGPVVRLWRRARRTKRMPDPELLAQARALVGYRNIRLDKQARTIQLLKPGMKLDFGGIAKGYAADAALNVLRKHQVTRALVAAAGDIALGDPPPDASGWKVEVAVLKEAGGRMIPVPTLQLSNCAVSTSGDAEQFVEIDGRRYSHIIDPRSGVGVMGRSSVTVIAPDCTASDSLATALSVLGAEAGIALVESMPGSAALVMRSEAGRVEIEKSRGWESIATPDSRGE